MKLGVTETKNYELARVSSRLEDLVTDIFGDAV